MKRVLMVAVLAGLGVMVGCEEKKADSIADKAKQAAGTMGDKAKDAGTAMKDAAGTAADKAKEMGTAAADKTKEMAAKATDAAKGEVKNLMDTIKGKVETLDKGGATLEPAKKSEFDKAMAGIKSTWADMTKGFDGLSSQTGDGMMKALDGLKTKGTELMATVKTTAEKFNIKLN